MKEEFKKRFRLLHGCIRKDDSITSRDTYQYQYFDTKDQVEAELQKHSDFYYSIGYKIWFSRIAEWNADKECYIDI